MDVNKGMILIMNKQIQLKNTSYFVRSKQIERGKQNEK